MTKKLFHAAMVISGGASYKSELRKGLLQRVFDEVVTLLPAYAQNDLIPLLTACENTPSLAWFEAQSHSRLERLMEVSSGYVPLAPAVRTALAILPTDEPALITLFSDFQILDPNALIDLVDEMIRRHPLAFLKIIFATSGPNGNSTLPQLLEDRHGGAYNQVDTVFATHSGGQLGESIELHFGRRLDVLASLLAMKALR